MEKQTGRKFGDTNGNPLLLSVRSVRGWMAGYIFSLTPPPVSFLDQIQINPQGAVVSMPGMMDTVLNLGMNDEICAAMVAATRNKKWAFDCYRRLIQVFSMGRARVSLMVVRHWGVSLTIVRYIPPPSTRCSTTWCSGAATSPLRR